MTESVVSTLARIPGPGARPGASDVLRALRRYWALALVAVLACAGLAGAGAAQRTPTATAKASILVQDPRVGGIFQQGNTDTTYVANQVAVLGLPATAQTASEILGGRGGVPLTAGQLGDRISVQNTGGNDLIALAYTDRRPEVAQAAVNAYVQAYVQMLASAATTARTMLIDRLDVALRGLSQQLTSASASARPGIQTTYDDLVRRRAEAIAIDPSGSAAVQTVSLATLPPLSTPTSPLKAALFGLGVGLLPAAVLCYLVAHARRRFEDRFEPEAVLGVPLLTEIPDFRAERLSSDVPVIDAPASASAEAFRFGATLVAVRQAERRSRVHAVISAASQDGKSTVTANLAITTAQSGKRVLVVDGDLGGRGLSFLLLGARSNGPGLVDVLEGRTSLQAAVVRVPLPGGASLDLLPGGTDSLDVAQLLSSSRSQDLLEGLRGDYDEVLIDVPPVLQVAYAGTLVRAADAVVVVIPHHAPVGRTEDLVERLAVLEVAALGYLYNVAPLRRELGVQSTLVTDDRRRPHRPPELQPEPPETSERGAVVSSAVQGPSWPRSVWLTSSVITGTSAATEPSSAQEPVTARRDRRRAMGVDVPYRRATG